MVSFDFIPAVQYMMYFTYIFTHNYLSREVVNSEVTSCQNQWLHREVAGSNPVEFLKNFQASRRNKNLRSSLRDNMVSFDFLPTVQYMMYFIYIFHS